MGKILTVSMAAYNVEDYIEQALKVFDNPEIIDDIEVFVIDDGGTDRTMEIAKTYADKYPKSIKLIHKENGGWGSTVNYGLNNASGKYFKLLDGDDLFDSKSLEAFISLLKTLNSDLICTPYRTFDSDSSLKLNTYVFNNVDLNREYTIGILHRLKNITMHMCTFKTESLRRGMVNISENCFYTDAEYVFKAIQCVDSIYLWSQVVYCYRLGREGQSVSLSGMRKHMKDHTRMLDVLLESYTSIETINTVKKEFAKRSLHELITTQYKMYIWQLNPASFKDEIRSFDKRLKKDFPELYEVSLKRVNLLRKTNFNGISLISWYECKKMN